MSLRQYAASVIGFARRTKYRVTDFAERYREDSLIRTEVNLAALQLGYALFTAGLAVAALFILYHEVTRSMTAAFVAALTSSPAPSPEEIQAGLLLIRTKSAVDLAAAIFAVTAIFGYLVTRFALAPAKNALARQKQFIGNIAHELRTPLSVIRVNTEVGLLEAGLSEPARDIHRSNLEEIDRISSLINNLLTLNALLRPEQMPFGPVDLAKVARDVTERLAGLARERQVEIVLSAAHNRLAWGNVAALEQVVMNLTKNAVQHTDKGVVRITIATAGDTVALTVADTGTGIGSEDLAHILEPFYRGDRARTRSGGTGSGLGLAIVNELVRLHRGRLRIQSAPGEGTRINVTLPAARRGQPHKTASARFHEIEADFTRRFGTWRR